MRCTACGAEVDTARPKCPTCGAWGTLQRFQRLADVAVSARSRLVTGEAAVDELLGGGFVPGVVYSLSGDPGAGKSTLALLLAQRIGSALYVAEEEAAEGVRMRAAERLAGELSPGIFVGRTGCVEELAAALPGVDVPFVVVDSLNCWRSPGVSGGPGGNDQQIHGMRELAALAEATGTVILALRHVNADGQAAGAKAVDHFAECTVEMSAPTEEGEFGSIRVRKNRHGRAPRVLRYAHAAVGLEYRHEA